MKYLNYYFFKFENILIKSKNKKWKWKEEKKSLKVQNGERRGESTNTQKYGAICDNLPFLLFIFYFFPLFIIYIIYIYCKNYVTWTQHGAAPPM